jgi:adenosylcobinamide-phosphate synthase
VPLVLELAVLLDLVLGEPGNRWHPVAWVASGLGWTRPKAPGRGPAPLVGFGALAVVGASLLVAALVATLERSTAATGWAGLFFQAWLLKCTFSLRGLVRAAWAVKSALALGSLEEARRLTGRHLVSRPTQELSAAHVVSATVESVAENFTDSVVAPLFFFLLFGLPGAWVYRVVNTADAMWGYHEGELEYFGKPAARLDDLLSWIPARIAGAGIVVGSLIAGEATGNAWRTMWRDRHRTASPNAGWTMAAMAGALGVALEKPGAYRLGEGPLPTVESIDRAVRVMVLASGLSLAASLLIAILGR